MATYDTLSLNSLFRRRFVRVERRSKIPQKYVLWPSGGRFGVHHNGALFLRSAERIDTVCCKKKSNSGAMADMRGPLTSGRQAATQACRRG